jgi:acyl carrier protein
VDETVLTREEITERVVQALVQALGASRADITPDASLAGDLEAESIDFLDIVFRLEKEFGIEIARGELFPQELVRDAALVTNGRLTDAGARELRTRFAFTDVSALEPGASVDELMNDLMTVRLVIDYVESKLRTGAAARL